MTLLNIEDVIAVETDSGEEVLCLDCIDINDCYDNPGLGEIDFITEDDRLPGIVIQCDRCKTLI